MPRETLPSSSPPSLWRRYLHTALWVLLALCVLYVGYCGWRTYRHVRDLGAHVAQLRSLETSTLSSLGPLLSSVQQDVHALRRDLALPLALAPHLGWLPWIGPTIEATPQLFSAGELLLGAIGTAWDALQEHALAILEAGEQAGSLGEAPQSLAETSRRLLLRTTDLEVAAADVHRAGQLLQAIDSARLIPRLSEPLSRIQPLTPLLTAAFDGLALAPQFLARPEEQAILLLAQNNDELRPTGGFISSIGGLQIKQGLPKLISLVDSYRVENWEKPHLDPPEPLRKYMGIDLWVTRDGNWWPDFPTSAKAVADLFTLNQDRPVAGVIAVNMQAAERLLEALTPLQLPDGTVVQSGEVEAMFRQSWSLDLDTLVTDGVVITATQPFLAVDIELNLAQKSGRAWFDSIELEDLQQPGVNLVRNSSFEQDDDLDGLPDEWTPAGLAVGDHLVDDVAHSGQHSLQLTGDLEREKRLTQRIVLRGSQGTQLRLAGLSRTDNISSGGGTCALRITLVPEASATTPQQVDAGFPVLTHDWASAGSAKILGAWWAHRKDFMNLSTQAAVRRMASNPSQVPWLDVLAAVKGVLDERQVQFYMADPALQALIRTYGWAGALSEAPGDFVMVVDTNVGYNKVTTSVDQAVEYLATIEPSGDVRAELAISYHNRSTQAVDKCDKDRQYLPIYDSLAQGCYWDYVRVYVPSGAQLQGGEGGDEPFQELEESGRTVFATSMELKPGEERVLRLKYALPANTRVVDRYELTIQKQSGTEAMPLRITIQGTALSPGQNGALAPTASTPDEVVYRTDLRTDRHLAVSVGR